MRLAIEIPRGSRFPAAAQAQKADHAREVERLVARTHRVALGELVAPGRATGRVKWARHTAMYLQRVVLELTCEEIASRYGHHRTSVAHACRKVEDRRDERRFDLRLQKLELRLVREIGRMGR